MSDLKAVIDKALSGYLCRFSDRDNILFRMAEYALFPGGKRIRPALCLEACLACGGGKKRALPQACAIEFIHNYSLVHDDLPSMDNDDMRRGKPACHKRFGEANAVLVGDALLTLAFRVLCEIKDGRVLRESLKAISSAAGLRGIAGGQCLDIKYMKKSISRAFRTKINMLKTGSLFVASARAGGIAARASGKKIKGLTAFGGYFGRAFQLRDDIDDREHSKGDIEARRRELAEAVESAKAALEIFGKKADNLRVMAEGLTGAT